MNTSVHSPIRLFRAENILDLQTNLRDQFMHSYKDKMAASSDFISPESHKGMDSPTNLASAEKMPTNYGSNPRLALADSPSVSNSNLINLMNNKNNTSNGNIKTLKEHQKLKR